MPLFTLAGFILLRPSLQIVTQHTHTHNTVRCMCVCVAFISVNCELVVSFTKHNQYNTLKLYARDFEQIYIQIANCQLLSPNSTLKFYCSIFIYIKIWATCYTPFEQRFIFAQCASCARYNFAHRLCSVYQKALCWLVLFNSGW